MVCLCKMMISPGVFFFIFFQNFDSLGCQGGGRVFPTQGGVQKFNPIKPNKNSIFSCSHYCSCFFFVLISYSLDTQVMLILILIDDQYSQKAVFSILIGLNCQNHSSGSLHLVKIPTTKSFDSTPDSLLLFGKPWGGG